MNPRRVHELMREHFPAFSAVKHEWVNVCGAEGADQRLLASILKQHISSPEVLVEVHRKVGAYLPVEEAVPYIAAHVGEGEVRIADRAFKSFVVVAINAVATGWRAGA